MCVHAQLCPTLCDPIDYSPVGSSVRGINQQEYWSGLPFPPPKDFPNPGIKPMFPMSPALEDRFFTTKPHGKPVLVLKYSLAKGEEGREDEMVRYHHQLNGHEF